MSLPVFSENKDWEESIDFLGAVDAFYGAKKADAFKMLLTEHFKCIGGALVNADQDNDISKADRFREG